MTGLRTGILPLALLLAAPVACAPHEEPAEREPHVWTTLAGAPPRIIAEGSTAGDASGHTLSAFERAIEQGAEVVAPVLAMSADGMLVAQPERRPGDIADVVAHSDANRTDAGASFEDVLDLAAAHGVRVQPHVLAPAQLREAGLDPLPELVRILRERGLDIVGAPVAIQSDDPFFLSRLDAQVDTPLVMRVFPMRQIDPDADALQPSVSLEDLAAYAEGVAPASSLLIAADGSQTGLFARARARRLLVYPWPAREADGVEDLRDLLELGVDGVSTGSPDVVRRVRAEVAGE